MVKLIKYNEIFTLDDGSPFDNMADYIPDIKNHNYSPDFFEVLSINFLLRYGERYISPIVESLLKLSNSNKEETISLLGTSFSILYGQNLNYLHKAMFSSYNPIENYSATETYTDTRQLSDKTVDSLNKTITDNSTTDTDIDTENTVNTEIKKSGYNVAEPITDTIQNTNENNTSTNTETVERSGNETHAGQSDKTVAETLTHTLQRSGNIGVTTSQQMIESEIELRKKEFWDIVMSEFANYCTLSIY